MKHADNRPRIYIGEDENGVHWRLRPTAARNYAGITPGGALDIALAAVGDRDAVIIWEKVPV